MGDFSRHRMLWRRGSQAITDYALNRQPLSSGARLRKPAAPIQASHRSLLAMFPAAPDTLPVYAG